MGDTTSTIGTATVASLLGVSKYKSQWRVEYEGAGTVRTAWVDADLYVMARGGVEFRDNTGKKLAYFANVISINWVQDYNTPTVTPPVVDPVWPGLPISPRGHPFGPTWHYHY